jgi:hypothetical protein
VVHANTEPRNRQIMHTNSVRVGIRRGLVGLTPDKLMMIVV